MNHSKRQKGDIAELKVALRAAEKGWICSKPLSTARYDLILDEGNHLYRVQVKYADSSCGNSTGAVKFTCNNGPNSPLRYSTDDFSG